ncbi:hypothetical protein TREES_T100021076 [Tupaia chinensis]|uniref:Uncharacterized protein n=1 Tax=Tupaia chinensis TaxID=246437 RepID=L9JB18_TUPCH|nr:hypothetical protein TREES_T100021076 [Tupaia chinensis]
MVFFKGSVGKRFRDVSRLRPVGRPLKAQRCGDSPRATSTDSERDQPLLLPLALAVSGRPAPATGHGQVRQHQGSLTERCEGEDLPAGREVREPVWRSTLHGGPHCEEVTLHGVEVALRRAWHVLQHHMRIYVRKRLNTMKNTRGPAGERAVQGPPALVRVQDPVPSAPTSAVFLRGPEDTQRSCPPAARRLCCPRPTLGGNAATAAARSVAARPLHSAAILAAMPVQGLHYPEVGPRQQEHCGRSSWWEPYICIRTPADVVEQGNVSSLSGLQKSVSTQGAEEEDVLAPADPQLQACGELEGEVVGSGDKHGGIGLDKCIMALKLAGGFSASSPWPRELACSEIPQPGVLPREDSTEGASAELQWKFDHLGERLHVLGCEQGVGNVLTASGQQRVCLRSLAERRLLRASAVDMHWAWEGSYESTINVL